MIIEKVILENYLCYYGKKIIELSNGLNIILGENGEGKTKFYEAIEWLFQGNNQNLAVLVSKKAIHEHQVGEEFKVSVSVAFKLGSEKYIISKSFLNKKLKDGSIEPYNYSVEGIEESSNGERSQVDGKVLLDQIFPVQIRRYSMFKGESELDIFNNDDALINLINHFSDAKYFDKYAIRSTYLREQSDRAVESSVKLDKKNIQVYKGLEEEISALERKRHGLVTLTNLNEAEIQRLEQSIQEASKYVQNASDLEIYNKRIKKLEDEIARLMSLIDEGYTTKLFDENWINIYFEQYLSEYSKKVSLLSSKRRKEQSDYDTEIGIRLGEKKAKADLLNNAIPLPINVPSKLHMEEMLKDEICKVCNRDAKKGSEAYEFMYSRLKEYIDSQLTTDPSDEMQAQSLFHFDYTSKLVQLSSSHEDNLKTVRNVKEEMRDLFEFNDQRKNEILDLQQKLEAEIENRNNILGNSKLAADKLSDVLLNYTSWQNELKSCNTDHLNNINQLKNLDSELKSKKEEKNKIDLKSAKSFLLKTRDILTDIAKIFHDTKELKFEEFIQGLEKKANIFFKKINVNSFTGKIVITRKQYGNKNALTINLYEDDKPFFTPNQALETSKHIAVLFAISEIASEAHEELYPMIFDAPISSFGENKAGEFLNLIYETQNQKILLIKDFIINDKKTDKLTVKKEFDKVKRHKAFMISLKRPFDSESLKTIDSQFISL
ncbi:MAG: hypothetical protein FJX80_02675 [Bacteroidetes bacterium]|nr:hypothetical protein [Bacteroidota bacterium]